MSRTVILKSGTGDFKGVAGVKTAKLCEEQDQIGKRLSSARTCFRVGSLEGKGNFTPREMILGGRKWEALSLQNPAYSKINPIYGALVFTKAPTYLAPSET